MSDSIPITPQGLLKLKEELKYLKSVERPKIVLAIEEARAHGDLSENAEYDAAKNRQGQINSRMLELEDKIARAQVIDPATLSSDKVVFGATVKLLDLDSEEEVKYQIVGADESDVKEGKISILSPIAKSLIGRKQSDIVKITTPKGSRELEVLKILFE
ncbi:MAG: transcription elongation factor GreA [Deltaproteobacteria bacterium]|nr:transcription elongation factor GreA [Deltaproteobacteria bacterium]